MRCSDWVVAMAACLALSSCLLLQRQSRTPSTSSAQFSSTGSRPATLTLSPSTHPEPCCLVSYLLTLGSVWQHSELTAHPNWAAKKMTRQNKKRIWITETQKHRCRRCYVMQELHIKKRWAPQWAWFWLALFQDHSTSYYSPSPITQTFLTDISAHKICYRKIYENMNKQDSRQSS